ncbi:MAG: transglutaminase-like domain-containing protein [Chitinophagaceae bacterium]
MKKAIINTITAILIAYTGKCQLTTQDSLVLRIPEQSTYTSSGIADYVKSQFPSDSARIRALFVWVGNNISYDIDGLRLAAGNPEKKSTADVLKTRKGVCGDYAGLLAELCNQCNIKSIVIPGYARYPDGSIGQLSHAWVAARLYDKWWLFDPTWAAGTVKDNRFTGRFSNRFYKLLPEEMIKDHMPFDPLYQFLYYPVTSQEFYDGKTTINSSKKIFSFRDSLEVHSALPLIDQIRNTARRISTNGILNDHTRGMLKNLQHNQQSLESKAGYEQASRQFQQAIVIFNRYIENKNKRFSAITEDKQIGQMIDSVLQRIQTAKLMLVPVVANDDRYQRILDDINKAILELSQRVDEEKLFVSKYLQTDRTLRKQ